MGGLQHLDSSLTYTVMMLEQILKESELVCNSRDKAHDSLEQHLYKAEPRLLGIVPSIFSFGQP